MAADNQERRHIVINARHPGGVAPFADCNELMQQDHTAEPHARFDFAVAAYLGVVAHHDFVLEHAVMADMHAYHQKIIIADFRESRPCAYSDES